MNSQMKELMKDLVQLREKMEARKYEASPQELFELFVAEHEILSSVVFRLEKEVEQEEDAA